MANPMTAELKRIEPFNDRELYLEWADGEKFSIPYLEMRFECPCAGCNDEMTGAKTLRRESIAADVRPLGARPVGRYAIALHWSDGHETGMYHFDRLRELCVLHGTAQAQGPQNSNSQ